MRPKNMISQTIALEDAPLHGKKEEKKEAAKQSIYQKHISFFPEFNNVEVNKNTLNKIFDVKEFYLKNLQAEKPKSALQIQLINTIDKYITEVKRQNIMEKVIGAISGNMSGEDGIERAEEYKAVIEIAKNDKELKHWVISDIRREDGNLGSSTILRMALAEIFLKTNELSAIYRQVNTTMDAGNASYGAITAGTYNVVKLNTMRRELSKYLPVLDSSIRPKPNLEKLNFKPVLNSEPEEFYLRDFAIPRRK